jgi:hypothetical protein
MRGQLLLVTFAAAVGGMAGAPAAWVKLAPPPETARPAPTSRASSVQIEMRNVRLHLDEGIVADITRLRGEMRSVSGGPPNFDDTSSYILYVQSAEMWMDSASLTELMNRHVFAYKGAPLSNISMRTTADGRLEQKALLHKGVRVPVTMTASVAATPEGKLRLHVESEKALGVGATGLLHLFGLKVQSLVHLDPARGVAISGDDIDLDLTKVLPPPHIVGRLTRVDVDGDRLHQVIGAAESGTLAPKDTNARNYIYFSGATLRFGKLTMTDTDLQLIDADPADPFDFFPARYQSQLVAGYSKNTPNGGLRTYMPDYAKVAARRPAR